MGVTTTKTNKPFNPRGNDQSPLAYNKAAIYSGKALSFDGVNDYVDLDGFTMAGTNATFIFTAKWNSISGINYIFDLDPQRLVLGSQLGTEISIYDNVSWKKFADWDDTTNTNVYALTIEGTTAKLYLNGQPFGNILTLGTTIDLSATTQFSIGSSQTKLASYFNGQISGTKLFNTALTAAQVADLYNNPEKIVPTGVDNTALKLWLPMQEGAGTTAYDGSGNGNHGTISGATYVHGIGAPVAQTAVINWNKGENYFNYSESFSQGYWTKTFTSITEEQTTAPNGLDTADQFKELTSPAGEGHFAYSGESLSGTQLATASVYLKDKDRGFGFAQIAVDGAVNRYTIVVDLSDGSVTDSVTYGSPTNTAHEVTSVGNGWYRLSVSTTRTSGLAYIVFGLSNSGTPNYTATKEPAYAGDNSSSIYAWGAQLNTSTVGPYTPTLATAQTSEVLLPQGLTTGRDITGVNLFENVRKQGALNLDGNSWAEVHDNASLDITDAITLEIWYYHDTTTSNEGLLGRWSAGSPNENYLLNKSASDVRFYIFTTAATDITASISLEGWYHVVGTYDGANQRIYLNGLEITSTAKTGNIPASTSPVEIGRYYKGPYEQTGQLAQPRIYNRALTAEEVQRNYDAGKNIYS